LIVVATAVQNAVAATTTTTTTSLALAAQTNYCNLGLVLIDATVNVQNRFAAASAAATSLPGLSF
jgi:hypothetical protein